MNEAKHHKGRLLRTDTMTSYPTSEYNSSGRKPPVPSRRRALAGLLLFALTALFGTFGRMAMSFMQPVKPANSYGGIVEAGFLTDLPAVGSNPRAVPGGRFWLVHNDDGISALHSSCTHLECLFSWDSEKKLFVCPCHGSEFSTTGQVMKGPAERDLDRFPIQLVAADGTVLRDSTQKNGAPLLITDLLDSYLLPEDAADSAPDQKPILVRVDTAGKIIST